jgi:hypothetical protein
MSKKDKLSKSDTIEKSFIAFVIKGNRQIIQREVTASKRFRVGEDTYRVKDDCIFYKNIDDKLQSVSYYRESNPNPYDFKCSNEGLTEEELDRFFAEDFYNIIVNIQPENRGKYILLVSIFTLILTLVFMVCLLIREFIL